MQIYLSIFLPISDVHFLPNLNKKHFKLNYAGEIDSCIFGKYVSEKIRFLTFMKKEQGVVDGRSNDSICVFLWHQFQFHQLNKSEQIKCSFIADGFSNVRTFKKPFLETNEFPLSQQLGTTFVHSLCFTQFYFFMRHISRRKKTRSEREIVAYEFWEILWIYFSCDITYRA